MSSAEYHDVKLQQREDDSIYDIDFDASGDFVLEDSFDTSIIMSLFIDRRADESEVRDPLRRRGFWGDLILFADDDDIKSGSKLWLVYGRRTQTTINRLIDAVKVALSWLVTRGFATDIRVDANFTTNGIQVDVKIIVRDNKVEKFNFKLWENGAVTEVTTI